MINALNDIASLVDDRPADGVFRVRREIFTDPAIFDLEMRHIFERTWVFLGIESQLAKPHDYFRAWIGRHPVVVSRAADGTLRAFFNSCRHRGALVCHHARGNAKYHVCAYHGWAYDSAGRNLDIKDRKDGCYAEPFDRQDHDLAAVPRFASYRGFLFGSLDPGVHDLDEHLNGAKFFLDLLADQGPNGLELVPGMLNYTYKGNWKLQI
jgi:benzoate/toluate 1,2-dioxygenase alpha subunit